MAELAKQAAVSSETIENLENNKNVYLSTLAKVAAKLGVQVRDIMEGDAPPPLAKPRTIILKIEVDADDSDETTIYQNIIKKLSEVVGGEGAMEPKGIKKGCIEVELEVTDEQMKRIVGAYEAGKLKELNIADLKIAISIFDSSESFDVHGVLPEDTNPAGDVKRPPAVDTKKTIDDINNRINKKQEQED